MVATKPVNTSPSGHAGLLGVLLSLTGILAAGLLLRIATETLGLIFLWRDQGAVHSCSVMMAEWQWLAEMAGSRQWLVNLPMDFMRWINEIATSCTQLFTQWARGSFASGIHIFAETMTCSLSDIFIRLMRLLLSAPVILLCTIVGSVDGLVIRDLRRFGVGYESGFLHHRIRNFAGACLCSVTLAYLAIPFAIASMWLALFTGFMVLVVFYLASSFKKYL